MRTVIPTALHVNEVAHNLCCAGTAVQRTQRLSSKVSMVSVQLTHTSISVEDDTQHKWIEHTQLSICVFRSKSFGSRCII